MRGDLVLTCDPSPQMRRGLQAILRRAGYEVLSAGTGAEALEAAVRDQPHAVILELALPDLDGIEVCRRLRACDGMAILVLSEIDDECSKIAAFKSGADDYMSKPFSPGELVARLAARLRAGPSALRFELDGLTIDLAAHLDTIEGAEVHLTPIEFAFLRVLATSRGPVTYGTLATSVWQPLPGNAVRRVRSHIANLRAKLDGGHPRDLIRTEAGIGYRFASAGQRPSLPPPRQPAIAGS
jgi:two-component system KDP operon response regulator KdpE